MSLMEVRYFMYAIGSCSISSEHGILDFTRELLIIDLPSFSISPCVANFPTSAVLRLGAGEDLHKKCLRCEST